MESRELERIRFTTRHFNDLQGLRYGVPLGLITLGGGLSLLGWEVHGLRAVGLAAALGDVGAKRYYRSAFGAVEQPALQSAAEVYPVSIFSPAGAALGSRAPGRR